MGETAKPIALNLAGPVRQRLVQLAGEVLGRMPAEEIPPTLRAVARFTPSKRARLGATALAAALDADPVFRARVADVVAAAWPQLVESLRQGASTAASEPIDTAVLAYLVRPEGWEDVVAESMTRYSDEQADRDAGVGTADLVRLRGEVAELRAHVKGEAARTRTAIDGGVADLAADAEQLRRSVRTRTSELRAAERSRDEALARVAAAERVAVEVRSANEAEVRTLRARLSELEREGDLARRGSRTVRELDDARVRLLLDTMTSAASGLRHELALPAGTLRPADAVVVAQTNVSNHTAGDPAMLDRLLGLPQMHLIVDGYNVTKTAWAELALVDQRNRLMTGLAALQSRCGAEVTIAFDGAARPPSQPRAPRGVRVLFSPVEETADDLIRRLVAAEPMGRPVLVATTDGQVVTDALSAGAWTVPAAVLVTRLA